MDIKDQRNRLLELLTLWTNRGENSASALYRDSQELIREINEQTAPEGVVNKCSQCFEFFRNGDSHCGNIYCGLYKKDIE